MENRKTIMMKKNILFGFKKMKNRNKISILKYARMDDFLLTNHPLLYEKIKNHWKLNINQYHFKYQNYYFIYFDWFPHIMEIEIFDTFKLFPTITEILSDINFDYSFCDIETGRVANNPIEILDFFNWKKFILATSEKELDDKCFDCFEYLSVPSSKKIYIKSQKYYLCRMKNNCVFRRKGK
jgi:hypothetical protein